MIDIKKLLTKILMQFSKYLPLTGGTLTGALNGTSANFSGVITPLRVDTNATVAMDNTTTPTSDVTASVIRGFDSNSKSIAYVTAGHYTTNYVGARLMARRTISGDDAWNSFGVYVDTSGEAHYGFTSKPNFRSDLGLTANATRAVPTTSSVNATHSISANSYYEFEITVSAVSGRFPNIRGFNITGTNSSLIHVMGCYLSGSGTSADPYKAHLKCRNMHTAAISATGYVYILWT